jgi:hypothetical protein
MFVIDTFRDVHTKNYIPQIIRALASPLKFGIKDYSCIVIELKQRKICFVFILPTHSKNSSLQFTISERRDSNTAQTPCACRAAALYMDNSLNQRPDFLRTSFGHGSGVL